MTMTFTSHTQTNRSPLTSVVVTRGGMGEGGISHKVKEECCLSTSFPPKALLPLVFSLPRSLFFNGVNCAAVGRMRDSLAWKLSRSPRWSLFSQDKFSGRSIGHAAPFGGFLDLPHCPRRGFFLSFSRIMGCCKTPSTRIQVPPGKGFSGYLTSHKPALALLP